jgi:hypothetical protein
MNLAKFPTSNDLLRSKFRMAVMRAPQASVRPLLGAELSAGVGTNETIRDQVALLITLGVSQTALAKRMGVNVSWFNRWINGKAGDRLISVGALDGFAGYLADLSAAIHQAGAAASEAYAQVARAAEAKTPPTPEAHKKAASDH